MKRLFNNVHDVTDYLITDSVETVIDTISDLSKMAKTANVHSIEERQALDEESVALILYHPDLDELKKFACDSIGITEININLLANQAETLPKELIKIAANNLGCAAKHYKIDIPENLQEFQTNEWTNPLIDIRYINKSAFYKKLQNIEKTAEEHIYALPKAKKYVIDTKEDLEKAAKYFNDKRNNLSFPEKIIYSKNFIKQAKALKTPIDENFKKYANLNINKLGENFTDYLNVRINLTKDQEIIELYQDILEKKSELSPIDLAIALNKADDLAGMDRAIDRRMVKNAAETVFNLEKTSWFDDHIVNLNTREINYLGSRERGALLSPEGEDVFNSLPKPTKDRLIRDLS